MTSWKRVPIDNNVLKLNTRRLTPLDKKLFNLDIHTAAKEKNYFQIEKLISLNYDINSQDKEGNTVLHYAIITNDINFFFWLLLKGASLNIGNNEGRTPFFEVVIRVIDTNELELLEQCRKYKPSINVRDATGKFILHYIAEKGSIQILEQFSHKLEHLDYLDQKNQTPLITAIRNENNQVAIWLIEHEADINAVCLEHKSVLHHAVYMQADEIIEKLLLKGALVDFRDKNGRTPLMNALDQNYRDTVRILMKYGANVNAKDKNLNTPLHRIAKTDDLLTIKILLENGAENLKNVFGKTPVDIAAKLGLVDIGILINESDLARCQKKIDDLMSKIKK